MSLSERLLAFILQPFVLSRRKHGDTTSLSQKNPVEHLSYSDIAKLWENSCKIDANTFVTWMGHSNKGRIASIGSDTVVKYNGSAQEFRAMELVCQETVIPVPPCFRFFDGNPSYLAMGAVEGVTVDSVWDQLGIWMRFRVVVSLWHFVHQLRSISRRNPQLCRFPGPLGDTPQLCTGRFFTDPAAGPFRSYAHMAAWYRNRLLVMQIYGPLTAQAKKADPYFDDRKPLVFTHQDLHMRNLMLGKDGQLWMIDWADAGFYPEWFEGANMKRFFIEQGNSGSWNRLCSWIFGDYESRGQYPYIDSIQYSLVALKNEVADMVGMKKY